MNILLKKVFSNIHLFSYSGSYLTKLFIFVILLYLFLVISAFGADSVDRKLVQLTALSSISSEPVWSPDGRMIAFQVQSKYSDIYIMPIDINNPRPAYSSQIRQITFTKSNDYYPALSPDGTKVAFSSKRKGNFDIFIRSLEDSTEIQLTNDPADDILPYWSPDGSRIVFQSNRGDDPKDDNLWIVPVSGGTPARLTTDSNPDRDPCWSMDNSKIVFSSYRGDSYDIWVVSSAGGTPTQITKDDTYMDFFPSFSPDGKKIVYQANRGLRGKKNSLWIVDVEGGEPELLIETASDCTYPQWSPDGKTILFQSVAGGRDDIWAIPADGGNPYRPFTFPQKNRFPRWSSDGKKIVFSSSNKGYDNIYIYESPRMSVPITQITSGIGDKEHPSFSPDGSKIAFLWTKGDTVDLWTVSTQLKKVLVDSVMVDRYELTRLTDDEYYKVDPMWSPKGDVIIYASNAKSKDLNLWIINPNTKEQKQITTNPANDYQPAISPDGKSVAFCSERSGSPEIWLLSLNDDKPDAKAKKLTTKGGTAPTWSNDGKYIIYESTHISGDYDIMMIPIDGGEPIPITSNLSNDTYMGDMSNDRNPQVSPVGSKIVFESDRSGKREIWICNFK